MQMTKKQEDTPRTAVAVQPTTQSALAGVSDEMFQLMAPHAGAGLENVTTDDIALPFLGVLQKMSKAVDEAETDYVPGAKAGMLINTVTREVIDGAVEVVPVHFEKVWVEWVPRNAGGGWVATYTNPADAEKNRKKDTLTEIVDTANHYILYMNGKGEWEPAILSCTSKKLKASRSWNSAMGRVTFTVGNEKKVAASWSRRYVLRTTAEKNEKGSYFNIKIEETTPFETGWVDPDTFKLGYSFYEQIIAGKKKASYETGSPSDVETMTEPVVEDADDVTF